MVYSHLPAPTVYQYKLASLIPSQYIIQILHCDQDYLPYHHHLELVLFIHILIASFSSSKFSQKEEVQNWNPCYWSAQADRKVGKREFVIN